MKTFRLTLLWAPIVYLFAIPAVQLYFLDYCFRTQISANTILIIFGFSAVFCASYAFGFTQKQTPSISPIPENILNSVVIALLIASVIYVCFATCRVIVHWDAFSKGSAAARFILMQTRTSVTVLGFANALFMGAPPVLLLFVTLYGDRLKFERLFKSLALLFFGCFVYLFALEGGRSPFILVLTLVVIEVIFRFVRGAHLRSVGPISYLVGIATVFAVALTFSYKEIAAREQYVGREDAKQTEANFTQYLRSDTTTPHLRSDTTTPPQPTGLSASTIVACFYLTHSPRSIDRIVSKGADQNLFGFYMMPNYHKLAQLLGIVKQDWIFYSDYYEITGLYSGLIGAALIDFSWFGVCIMALVGFFAGHLASMSMKKGFDDSPLCILASIAFLYLLLVPIVDLTSTAMMQSMIPWLAMVTGALKWSQSAVSQSPSQLVPTTDVESVTHS